MTSRTSMDRNLWSIVLAGGEGERVKPLVLRWLGRHRPKQYCTFVGRRSMFEHTVDRAIRIASAERTVVVAAQHHRHETGGQLIGRPVGKLIHQPMNRDTAAGIFLPLSFVRARDPQALPQHAWSEVFAVIVDLARDRRIVLHVYPNLPHLPADCPCLLHDERSNMCVSDAGPFAVAWDADIAVTRFTRNSESRNGAMSGGALLLSEIRIQLGPAEADRQYSSVLRLLTQPPRRLTRCNGNHDVSQRTGRYPALFMTIRGEIAQARGEMGTRRPEEPRHT